MKRYLLMPWLVLPVLANADESAIRQAFAERYPHATIRNVTATPISGIYEVFADGQVLYADAKGDYLLIGTLVDTRTRTNLTQQRLEMLKKIKFDSLPFDKAFTVVKGKGERQIAVFSDPDCPFCKRLEQELARMDNLTIHVFLYPLAELHPQAVGVARAVWCAADRAAAWNGYMLEGKKPEAEGNCPTPIDEIASLAKSLGITGTPTLVLPDGRRLEGALPADRLEALLKGS